MDFEEPGHGWSAHVVSNFWKPGGGAQLEPRNARLAWQQREIKMKAKDSTKIIIKKSR